MSSKARLSDDLHRKLAEVLEERLGLYFPAQKWADLDRGLAASAPELGFGSLEECAQSLVHGPIREHAMEVLAVHLTIGETYFFRDPAIFRALEERVLRDLIASRRKTTRRLRLWSAGCCTGEEPYSLAILLARMIPDIEQWDVTLLATDVNPRFLARASQGYYRAWSFRGTSPIVQKSCFTMIDKHQFQIRERYRRMVTFASLNLAEDTYPSILNNTNAMDLILCRNVLMYLTAAKAKRAAENLHDCLVEGGWLVVSATEAPQDYFSPFETVNFDGATFYRKTHHAPPHQPVTPPRPLRPHLTPHPRTPPADRAGDKEPAKSRQAAPTSRAPAEDEVVVTAMAEARRYANEARLDEALEWCDRAIEADKLDPVPYYLRAAILHEKAENAEAITALKRALYLNSGFVMAHFTLATLLRIQGRTKEADKHFHNAAALAAVAPPNEVLPESGGITAARLSTLIALSHPSSEND